MIILHNIKEQLDECKKYDFNPADYMTVIPVPFNTEAKNMLIHTKELLEYEARPLIGINQKFDKLITALRTAVSDDSGRLIKRRDKLRRCSRCFQVST